MNRADVKVLECWVTVPEAMATLGVSKQGLHKMMWDQDLFHPDEIRRVGSKPMYLLSGVAVDELKAIRDSNFALKEGTHDIGRKLSELRSTIS